MNFVEFEDISIQFPGVRALSNVSFNIPQGEVMALCGENGAGKSTLGKILAGVYSYRDYTGEVRYKDKILKNHLPIDAEKNGIYLVHQELNLLREMTVAENIFLSHFPTKYGMIDTKTMIERSSLILKEIGLQIDPMIKVKELTVAMQQMVEIVKALTGQSELIIFDESTSALTNKEIHELFEIIRKLKTKGVTAIFISHKLDEIFEICDSLTVLKDGALVQANVKVSDVTKDDIVRMMIGREIKEMYPEKSTINDDAKPIFEIKNWNVWDTENPDKKVITDVDFSIKENEILGMYGLVGAGRTELVNSIFEGTNKFCSGEIYLQGEQLQIHSPSDAVDNGIALITEDRKFSGLFLNHSVNQNISVASLKSIANFFSMINHKQEDARNDEIISSLQIKISSKEQEVGKLSGGNQQKVILGKWLLTNLKVLILDEPTKGIDVGAKAEIYKILRMLAAKGIAILIVSSELPEIIGAADRAIVIRGGMKVAELTDLDEELLVSMAMGRK